MQEKLYLLYTKNNKHFIHLFFLFLLFILILILFTYDVDSYHLVGLKNSNDTNHLDIVIPYDKTNIFEGKIYVVYNHQKYYIEDIKYGEINLINNIPYINVELKMNFEIDKEVIDFQVFYNRRRIIDKIKNIIKEG